MKKKMNKKTIFIILYIFVCILLSAIAIFSREYEHKHLKEEFEQQIKLKENLLNQKIEELEKKQKENEEKIKKSENITKKIGTTSTTRANSPRKQQSSNKWIWANASAYCPCKQCCGKTNGITASGAKAKAKHTIAASNIYKFGTKIEIEGYGIYTVEDRGGAISGNKIDIFFNTHQEALKFGRRQLKIRVVE